jgi:Ca-activated chloride channel family protein
MSTIAYILLILLAAQQTIRVDVSLVTIGVRVTDSRGRDVSGLQAGDFSVFEDGVEQKIALFSSDTQPLALGILLDRSSSMVSNEKISRAKEAARALVEGVMEGSEFSYIDFNEAVKPGADFTTDRQEVTSAIERTVAEGGTSLYDAVLEGLKLTAQARLSRQALVIVSDGADQHSTHTLREVIKIVRESETQIYTIGYFSKEEELLFRTSGSSISLINGDEVDNPRLVLEEIARESGAESYFPRSDEELRKAVVEITADLKSQYTIAFYPSSTDRDRYHRLRVAVRGGRYSVRARPGYGTPEFEPGTARREATRDFETNVERRAGRLVYTDDFSDPNSGWPVRPNAQYVDGGYRLMGENVVAANGPTFRDFHATVSVSLGDPPPELDLLPRVGNGLPAASIPGPQAGAGLLFRQTNQGYYALLIYPRRGLQTGYASLIQTDGQRSVELDRWPLLNRPAREHRIAVHCGGGTCDLYEGGSLLGRLKNVKYPEGCIGLLLSFRGEACSRR